MAKKKKSDNQIIDELLATSSVAEEIITAPVIEVVEEPAPAPVAKVKTEEKKAAGMYHNGKRITKVLTRLGKQWSVVIEGKRTKVLKSEIEIVG